MFGKDPVDERAEGGGEHQGAGAVDDHEEEAAGEQPAPGPDKRPDFGPDFFKLGLGALGCEFGGGGAPGPTGGRIRSTHLGCSTHIGGSVVCHAPLAYLG